MTVNLSVVLCTCETKSDVSFTGCEIISMSKKKKKQVRKYEFGLTFVSHPVTEIRCTVP